MVVRDTKGRFTKGGSSPRRNVFKKRLTKNCEVCKRDFYTYRNSSRFCSRECMYSSDAVISSINKRLQDARIIKRKAALGKEHVRVDGYVCVFKPSHPSVVNKRRKYVFKHRLIMEKHLGRLLNKQEVVHHIDGDVTNNKIENLMLFPNHSAHIRFHNL